MAQYEGSAYRFCKHYLWDWPEVATWDRDPPLQDTGNQILDNVVRVLMASATLELNGKIEKLQAGLSLKPHRQNGKYFSGKITSKVTLPAMTTQGF